MSVDVDAGRSSSARGSLLFRLRQLFSTATIALAVVGVAVVVLSAAQDRSLQWVRHSREVVRLAREARAVAIDRESELRGFRLTGDSSFVVQARVMGGALHVVLDSLETFTRDDAAQAERVAVVRAAVAQWALEGGLSAVPGAPASAPLPADREALLATIRSQLAAVMDAEEARYSERVRRNAYLRLFGLGIIATGLVVLGGVLVRSRLRLVTQTEMLLDQQERLEQQAVELEQQVQESQAQAEELEAANEELSRALGLAERAQVAIDASLQEQRRLEEQFRQAQKMEAVGRLAGGIAHDFNNLLTVISSYSALLLADFELEDPRREDVEAIGLAATRATALTRQLLVFSRKQVTQPRVLDLNGVVVNLDRLLRRLIGEDIVLDLELAAEAATVYADPSQIEQVIMNLVVNARDAMPHGGRLTIATANVSIAAEHASASGVAADDYVRLAVRDTGVGMSEAVRAQLFEPFFTTKEPGKGTGLGLATAYGIVVQAGGEIVVRSEPGQGAIFDVYLPVNRGGSEAVHHAPAHADARGAGTETILLVEDDDALRALARRILQARGYTVFDAGDGREALALCADGAGAIDLVVTDVVMPELGGRALVERITAVNPAIKVIFMSGYADDDILRNGIDDPRVALLQKPFTPSLLAQRVREVLDAPVVR